LTGGGTIKSSDLALFVAMAMVAVAILFVVFALTGADLCVWCAASGR
jgi:hypothetical protein